MSSLPFITFIFLQAVNCVRFSNNSSILVSGGVDKVVRIWDVRYISVIYFFNSRCTLSLDPGPIPQFRC